MKSAKNTKTKNVSFKLEEEIFKKMEEFREEKGINWSFFIRSQIKAYINEVENKNKEQPFTITK